LGIGSRPKNGGFRCALPTLLAARLDREGITSKAKLNLSIV
jgi:hypothetical protein